MSEENIPSKERSSCECQRQERTCIVPLKNRKKALEDKVCPYSSEK
jgi:hypothetical protein